MNNSKFNNIDISMLEKIIVNFFTPLEYVLVKAITDFTPTNPKFKQYIDEQGVWRGYWNSKIDDYKKLIQITDNNKGNIPKKVLDLYDSTLCGYIMKLSYKFLRRQP